VSDSPPPVFCSLIIAAGAAETGWKPGGSVEANNDCLGQRIGISRARRRHRHRSLGHRPRMLEVSDAQAEGLPHLRPREGVKHAFSVRSRFPGSRGGAPLAPGYGGAAPLALNDAQWRGLARIAVAGKGTFWAPTGVKMFSFSRAGEFFEEEGEVEGEGEGEVGFGRRGWSGPGAGAARAVTIPGIALL